MLIYFQSTHNIGPKTILETGKLAVGDKPVGAVSNRLVEVVAPIGGVGMSDENGFFHIPYNIAPCPGCVEWNTTSTVVYYRFSNFNPNGSQLNIEDGQNLGFSGYQSASKMNPALHQRAADHLRPFEEIQIIAINRKTGYMGSVKANYNTSSSAGLISFPISDIKMAPPISKSKPSVNMTSIRA